MNRSLTCFLGCFVAFISSAASAAEPTLSLRKECLHHLQQRTAAMQARDYDSMERFSNIYIKRCEGVDSPADFSRAYWQAGAAAAMRKQHVVALKYFEGCMRVSYGNASCQVGKVSALMNLNRKAEARKLHGTASKLVAAKLAAVKQELSHGVSGIEKELLEEDLESLEIDQQSLQLYAEQLEGD